MSNEQEIEEGELADLRNKLGEALSNVDAQRSEVVRLQAEATKYEKWWNDAKEENARLIDLHAAYKKRRQPNL